MQLRWLNIILICFLISCGGGGGGSGGGGSGGVDPPEPVICTYPAIVGYGFADRYIIRISGVVEEVPAPLVYAIDGFEEGSYFIQVQAVWHEQPDYPVNFNLYVWDDGYEVEPLNWFENFDESYLILELVK